MIKKFLKIIIICLILIIVLIFIFKSKSKISFDDTLFLKLFQSSQEKSNDNSKQNVINDYYEFNVDSKTEKIPLKTVEKVATGKKETKYKLKISNFQINFYKTLSKFKIYDTIETEKKFKIFSNLYLPISITKITNQEQEKIEKSYTKEDAIQIGTTKLEKIIEDEIGTNKNIIDKKVDVIENDNYIEVNVTYEVIENIGIQEKIE